MTAGDLACHHRFQARPDDGELVENADGGVVVDQGRENHRVQHVPGGRAGDMRPPTLGHDDEPLLLQSFDRLPDHRATDSELVAQRALGGEGLPRLQCTGHDQFDEFLDDDRPEPRQPQPRLAEPSDVVALNHRCIVTDPSWSSLARVPSPRAACGDLG